MIALTWPAAYLIVGLAAASAVWHFVTSAKGRAEFAEAADAELPRELHGVAWWTGLTLSAVLVTLLWPLFIIYLLRRALR